MTDAELDAIEARLDETEVRWQHARPLIAELRAARAENVRLQRELDATAFDLSLSMVQARNDQLAQENERLREALARIQTHQGFDENNCAMKSCEVVCELQRIAEQALTNCE